MPNCMWHFLNLGQLDQTTLDQKGAWVALKRNIDKMTNRLNLLFYHTKSQSSTHRY